MTNELPNKPALPIAVVTGLGWLSIAISAFFLALSGHTESGKVDVTLLLIARLFGICGFVTGVIAIFHERWTSGSLLLILSLALPFISLFLLGSL